MAHLSHAVAQPPSLQVVGGRLQSCQTRIVEVMQRCNALAQAIRSVPNFVLSFFLVEEV